MNAEPETPVVCYLGLGGNVGDVVANFKSAIKILAGVDGQTVLAASPVYKTPPWGMEDQDWFHNACLKLETILSPLQLLQQCKRIEADLKREKTVRWGPRSIDLDILLYGDLTVREEGLTIPHAEMLNRAFVLLPLSDLDPERQVNGKSVREWLAELDSAELQDMALPDDWWVGQA